MLGFIWLVLEVLGSILIGMTVLGILFWSGTEYKEEVIEKVLTEEPNNIIIERIKHRRY